MLSLLFGGRKVYILLIMHVSDSQPFDDKKMHFSFHYGHVRNIYSTRTQVYLSILINPATCTCIFLQEAQARM